jgi:hypothetical protein
MQRLRLRAIVLAWAVLPPIGLFFISGVGTLTMKEAGPVPPLLLALYGAALVGYAVGIYRMWNAATGATGP